MPLYLQPHSTTFMSLDIIYPIILAPATIAVAYCAHLIRKAWKKSSIETPEAEPYKFERDEFRPEFDEFTQMLVQRRMYRGRGDK
jgi:hypothetical protein